MKFETFEERIIFSPESTSSKSHGNINIDFPDSSKENWIWWSTSSVQSILLYVDPESYSNLLGDSPPSLLVLHSYLRPSWLH